jgi:hypothetical protein
VQILLLKKRRRGKLKEVENEDLSFLTSLFSPHFRGNYSKGPSISMQKK